MYKYIKENITNKRVNSILNEVRLPNGYFKVATSFMFPGKDGWDNVFNRDRFIHIDTENKTIKIWNTQLSMWDPANIDYLSLMDPELYNKFKANVVKVGPEQLPKEVKADIVTFVTTVRAFNRRAQEEGLSLDDRIKVTLQ